MNTYAKALVAILGAAVTAALGIVPPDDTLWQVLTVVSAALTAAAVYAVPNGAPDTALPGGTTTVYNGTGKRISVADHTDHRHEPADPAVEAAAANPDDALSDPDGRGER